MMGAARFKDLLVWNGENGIGTWAPIMSLNIKMHCKVQIPLNKLHIHMLECRRSSISECVRLCVMKGRNGDMCC